MQCHIVTPPPSAGHPLPRSSANRATTFTHTHTHTAHTRIHTRWSYAVLCLKISNAWHFSSEAAAAASTASRAHSDSKYNNINNTNKDNFSSQIFLLVLFLPQQLLPLLLLLVYVGFVCDFHFHIYLYVFTLAKLWVQVHTCLPPKAVASPGLWVGWGRVCLKAAP